jgi:hypothetical protein
MIRPAQHPRCVVTPRGLEITIPTPRVIGGKLIILMPLLLMLPFVPLMMPDVFVGDLGEWAREIDQFFGWRWIGIGLAATALLMAFSGFSNQHVVLGTHVTRYQQRIGRIVLDDEGGRLSGVTRVQALEERGRWWVELRRTEASTPTRLGPVTPEDAAELRDRIQSWLEAPGQLPIEERTRVAVPLLIAESALSTVTSRLTLVVPLLIGTGAALLLAAVWQVHEARAGRSTPIPRLDRVAEGRLAYSRWHLYSLADSVGAVRVYQQIAIEYVPDHGVPRALWLRTRPATGLRQFAPAYRRHAGRLGTGLEFSLTDRTLDALAHGQSWGDWHALARRPAEDFRDPHFAARTLALLDQPFDILVARWSSSEPDWRIAYSAAAPERAMPLWWAEAEWAMLQQVSTRRLAILAAIAILLIFGTLPRLVPGRPYRWIGRVAALAVVLALPWWVEHAERGAKHMGIDEIRADLVLDALRIGLPEAQRQHAFIRRIHPPAPPQELPPLLWTPEQSVVGPLLPRIGLDAPPPQLPLPDGTAVVSFMRERVAETLGTLDDDALAEFAGDYGAEFWPLRAGELHERVIAPVLCQLADERGAGSAAHRSITRQVRCDLVRG